MCPDCSTAKTSFSVRQVNTHVLSATLRALLRHCKSHHHTNTHAHMHTCTHVPPSLHHRMQHTCPHVHMFHNLPHRTRRFLSGFLLMFRQGNSSCCPPRPILPLSQRKIHTRVIYIVLLWADMNAATPLGAWGCSVISLVRHASVGSAGMMQEQAASNRTYCLRFSTSKRVPRPPFTLQAHAFLERGGERYVGTQSLTRCFFQF